jgi:hypothetical protein
LQTGPFGHLGDPHCLLRFIAGVKHESETDETAGRRCDWSEFPHLPYDITRLIEPE